MRWKQVVIMLFCPEGVARRTCKPDLGTQSQAVWAITTLRSKISTDNQGLPAKRLKKLQNVDALHHVKPNNLSKAKLLGSLHFMVANSVHASARTEVKIPVVNRG